MSLKRPIFGVLAAALLVSGCAQNGTTGATGNILPAQNERLTQPHASGAYRHGLVPMLNSQAAHNAEYISSLDLHYQGGTGGVGVTDGAPKIYLVFWGSQWGTQGVNSHGYVTFSNDPKGLAPYAQAFFSGLGTGGELWSGVMTQYCQGVKSGATFCPSTAPHVGYPTGGTIAGIWEDTSSAEPSQATGHQIAIEAENAAAHFGNTTNQSNRLVQYDIISATGTDPDAYQQNGFCAWHDYSGDSTLDGGGGASGPLLAFTNMPYVPDAGANCGAGFVNPGNALDGVSIVNGHEYAETITDQFPAGGWLSNNGEETGDLCAWVTSGPGRTQNITLTTGVFAVQGTWSNVANKRNGACAIKHAIVT